MTVGREGPSFVSPCSAPAAHTRSGNSREQSHVGHAVSASLPTADQGVAMSSCLFPTPSPSPFPPLSSAAGHPAANSLQSSSPGVQLPVSFPAIPKKAFNTSVDFATTTHHSPSPTSPSMGQGHSRSSPPVPSTPASSPATVTKGFQAALAGGMKLTRAFANRRKKSEDLINRTGQQEPRNAVQDQQPGRHIHVDSFVPLTTTASSKSHKPALNLNYSTAAMAADQSPLSSPPPPTPPPKSPSLQRPEVKSTLPGRLPLRSQVSANASPEERSSIIALSPGMTGAVKLLCMNEGQREQKEHADEREANAREKPREADTAREGITAVDAKEARRKSDSTMSYQTVRPGNTSNRTSRPVSMAESLQSNHTIKPVRISALISDGDFTMLEEDDETCKADSEDMVTISARSSVVYSPQKVSSEAARKTKSRRSLSLNLGSYSSWKAQPPSSASHHAALSLAEIKHPSYSMTEGMPPPMPSPIPTYAQEVPKIIETSTSQTGLPRSPRTQGGRHHHSKPSLWTNPSSSERKLPALPPQMSPPGHMPTTPSYPPQGLRAISVTSSLAPAAGRAFRDAVGRMGRAIGISASPSNASNSGHSSSASVTSDGYALTRTNSNQSSSAGHAYSPLSWGKRRTPDAPSGAWSVSSSVSDADHTSMTPGPSLGLALRAPMKGSGLVFGRQLRAAVKDTSVSVRSGSEGNRILGQTQGSESLHLGKAFEERALPAVVVRCAQHLLLWGIQEEGLFRVSGRAKHVATIRAEFDKGADYDMAACEPVDLDPHAVASVFKAYFRELPEPVLTAALLPYFERIVEQEMNADAGSSKIRVPVKTASRGPGLPSGPRPGSVPHHVIKKPPSLSTLALPSFKDIPPPSNTLIRAIRSLIARLPEENRDLLRTLVDVMNATAKNEKATKMPLANLLLVFCPTVQMHPPLLRILCEARGIWSEEGVPSADDSKKEEETLVVARTGSSSSEAYTDASEGLDERESLNGDNQASEDHPASMSNSEAPVESSIDPRAVVPRLRPTRRAREPLSTVYLDAESGSTSASSLPRPGCVAGFSPSPSPSSTPPMTSSAESLATPLSQSSDPHLPIEVSGKLKAEQEAESPEYIDGVTLPRRTPIQFPALPASVPSTPIRRRSTPLLSLQHITTMNMSPSAIFSSPSSARSNTSLPRKSPRKPSLQILLSGKASTSSLKGISKSSISSPITINDSVTAPQSASDSSVSTPQSAVTAPQGMMFVLPPVINSPLENSPLGLGMGLQITPPHTAALEAGTHYRDDEVESAKRTTPIADRYRTTSTSSSLFSVALAARSVPEVPKINYLRRSTPRRPTTSSDSSSTHLDLELGNEEDWTRSVLMAADIETAWPRGR